MYPQSHTHRCTCPCTCQESVECFFLPRRAEDGPYCPEGALMFTCQECRSADLCEHCGAHPRLGETFVWHDGDLMCPRCLPAEEEQEHEEVAGGLVVVTRGRMSGDVPTHALTFRTRMPAGYAKCLHCARPIGLTEVGEPCRGLDASDARSSVEPHGLTAHGSSSRTARYA